MAHNETHILTGMFMGIFLDRSEDPFLSSSVLSGQKDLIYLCSIFLVGAAVRHATDVLRIPLPFTVVVFFVGVVAGYLPLGRVADIGPHTLLYVFLPILIFEGAFAIDIYIFKQIFIQVMILAAPALAVMTILLAGTSMYLFKYKEWNWYVALTFGSILSATDPVAVVSIMKELGTSKRLALLIEGESMLNDGTAMVLFEIFSEMVGSEEELSVGDILGQVIWISLGGPLLGYVMAKVAVFWLQWTFNDSLTEIAITLSTAYLVFYIADDFLKVSAVLGVVTLGATLSDQRTSISPEVEVFLHSFWETLAFMANTLIFAICGFLITRKVMINAKLEDLIYLVILYFAVQVIRGITFMMFSPLLKQLGYGLTWQDALVSTWSGLRGAVGLALALIVFKSDNPKLSSSEVGGKILFHVSLIVVFTLLINATTVSHLLTFLGLTDVTPARRNAMKKAIRILDESRHKTLNVWKIDRFLTGADWDTVSKICMIEDPFQSTETTEEKELRERQGGICPRCNLPVPYVPTQSEIHNMLAEATRKYLKLLKQNFWLQFERGLLMGFSVRKLIELAEEAADKDCEMIKVRGIKRMWRTSKAIQNLKKMIKSQSVRHQIDVLRKIRSSSPTLTNVIYLMSGSQLLLLGIYGVDSLVVLSSEIIEIMMHRGHIVDDDLRTGFEHANLLMVVVCTFYFVFRLYMFQLVYIKTCWFFLNSIMLVLSFIEYFYIYIVLGLWFSQLVYHENVINDGLVKMFLYLRILRVLQLLEVINRIAMYFINRNIRARLTIGCDMARGFVRANELAIRLIDHISDDLYVQNIIHKNAEMAKMSVMRELGLLQGLHPDIALGVKTCHAIRSVLNVMREGMHHLIEEGGIDEPEGLLFVKVIEAKMKRLMAAPPKLEIPSTTKILAAIPWIDGEMELVDYIITLAVKKSFQYGEAIMRVGDPPNGIYFIISGLVKVEAPILAGSDTNLTMQTLDFLSTGNVIGEISVLTQKPRSATLTCETIVKTLFLKTNDLKRTCNAFNGLDPPLIARLWKVCAVRISINILANVPSYHGMRKETLMTRLENAELEHIDETDKFEISPNMVDVILILGDAQDEDTKEDFVGPCYIPKTVNRLVFSKGQSPRPLMFYAKKMLPPLNGRKLSQFDRSMSIVNLDVSKVNVQGLNKINF